MYDVHLAQGYAANGDLEFVAGCGQSHNEAAWSARLPKALDFLLPAREEPDMLAPSETRPGFAFSNLNTTDRTAAFQFATLFGFTYSLERSPDFSQWSVISTTAAESLPWSIGTLTDPAIPIGAPFFWRLRATAAP